MKKVFLILVLLICVLAACSSAPTPTPDASTSAQPLPAVVSASGKVLPEQWANLSFRAGGPIVELKAQSGDTVKAGDVIARLDDVDGKLAVAQAEAALAMAQAQLAQLKAGTRTEQIAQAEQAVAQADAAWKGAQAQYAQLQSGARSAEIAAAEAAVAKAASDLKFAEEAYNGVVEGRATAKEYGVSGGGLGKYEEQMRAQLTAIRAAYDVAQKQLAQLKTGATRNELGAAAANVSAAKAQLEQAKAQLDLLKAGASAEQIAVAEAGVKQAQAALDMAKAQLDKMQLTAPFAGTIGTVYVRSGELAQPGQSIVTLGNLGSLRVETTDLSETDVARVKEGQPVKVTFDALPGKTITGKVTRIAPMSTPGQSAVNYIVTVQLDEIDPALRWGMTAFVDVQVSAQ
ncbi:MAG TPA: efflux RND transporter periplasmic adaptor subunit [Anaerolineae bacterium]|nr:efflux RND transporter periplasmic adaptor subunit [Anaerolineae bacterium]